MGASIPSLCRLSYRSMVTMPAITGFCALLRTAVVSAYFLPGLTPGVGADAGFEPAVQVKVLREKKYREENPSENGGMQQ